MTHDLLEHTDDDLDRRLRIAMTDIAAAYRPGAATVTPARRHSLPRWVVGAAAAAVTVLGAAGVWALHDRSVRPAATVTTQVVPPSPPWLADLTVPDVEPPEWALALDPSLGVNDLQLNSPYLGWLYSQEPLASRWFVQADDDVATATLTVVDRPARAWDRSPNAEDYEVDGVEAQRSTDGRISWRTPGGVRTVTSRGLDETFVDEFVAEVVDVSDIDDLTVPDGFAEIHQVPVDTWQIAGDWHASLFRPRLDERDLMLSTWALRTEGAEPIAGGWLLGPGDGIGVNGDDGWLAVISVGDSAAMVYAPSSVEAATMRDIASLVSMVPAAQLPITSLITTSNGTSVTDADLLAGGQLEWGRWLAADATDTQTPTGVRCVQFLGAIQFDDCFATTAPNLTACRRVTPNSLYVDDTNRWVAMTTLSIDLDAPLTVTVADEPADYTIEQSGGMTFIHGTTSGAVHSISVTLPDGTELCPN